MKEEYYYIRYTITSPVTKKTWETNCVTDKHPFKWLQWFDFLSHTWKLIDWKSISKEEYEIGKDVIGIG